MDPACAGNAVSLPINAFTPAARLLRRRAPRNDARKGSVRAAGLVEAVAELLAGLEKWDVLLRDLDAVAGARVAPQARIAPLDREGAKTAQLDPVALRQSGGDLVKDRGDH